MLAVVVIGVISAIIIPILYNNVMGDVKEKRITTFYNKLSKATDNMLVSSGMQGYSDTMDFVNTLKKYVQIDKVCDSQHIAECWGTKKVVLGDDGKEWEINKTTNPRTLKIPSDKIGDSGYKDVVAIITADQVPMIISYNKACELNQNDRNWGTNGKSASLNCISGVFDWNGGRNPNKLGNDVLTLGESAGLGSSCAFEVNGHCYVSGIFPKDPMTEAECKSKKSQLGLKYCRPGGNDRYASIAEVCGGVQNLISEADLNKIANDLYPGKTFPADDGKYCKGECIDRDAAAKYGISFTHGEGDNSYAFVWSSAEYNSTYSMRRNFYAYGSEYYTNDRQWQGSAVFCKFDE